MVNIYPNQEIISAGSVDFQHISCPDCKAEKGLRATGLACMPRQETILDDTIEIESDPAAIAFDVRRIDCTHCEKSFILWDKALFDSQQTVDYLLKYVEKHTGQNLSSNGPVN